MFFFFNAIFEPINIKQIVNETHKYVGYIFINEETAKVIYFEEKKEEKGERTFTKHKKYTYLYII